MKTTYHLTEFEHRKSGIQATDVLETASAKDAIAFAARSPLVVVIGPEKSLNTVRNKLKDAEVIGIVRILEEPYSFNFQYVIVPHLIEGVMNGDNSQGSGEGER